MNDPVQMLIDAGAIPSTPFVAQSRYRDVALALWQRRPEDPPRAYVLRRFIPPPIRLAVAARHVVVAQDRPDSLAATHLGDPLLYWRIADANAVIDPNELTDTLGARVAIPVPPGM
jgi:hypothetical protein